MFRFPQPVNAMAFDGERYVSGLLGSAAWGDIQSEHYHRYLFALRFCAGKTVLDIASGEGYGSHCLGQVASRVVGVDADPAAVAFANRNYHTEQVSFRLGSAQAIPAADASFDVVVSFETLEHFTEHDAFAAQLRRVLRPFGLLVISSPNRTVYTEQSGTHNAWHRRELDRNELVNFLTSSFAHVRLFAQRPLVGSVIAPDGDAAEAGYGREPLEGFIRTQEAMFQRTRGLPDPPYYVALASDAPLPEAPASVLHNPALLQHIEAQRQQAADLARAATQQATEATQQATAATQQATAATQQATEATQQAIGFAAALETAQHEVGQARIVAAQASQRVETETRAALRQEAVPADEPNHLAGEVAALQQVLSACRQQHGDIVAQAGALRRERDEYAQRYDAISRSLAWRVTWPMRLITARLLRRR